MPALTGADGRRYVAEDIMSSSARGGKDSVTTRTGVAVLAAALVIGPFAVAAPALADGPVADISIRSVRLTDHLVLRIQVDYLCPSGFSVPLSFLPRAYASQQ